MEPLRPHQQREAALTLAEAFASDPLLEILAPDPGRRVKLGPPMMSVLLAYGMRYGHVWSSDDASAVAIWLHPESGPMTMARMLRAGMWRAPSMLGLSGMGRMSKAMSATEGSGPRRQEQRIPQAGRRAALVPHDRGDPVGKAGPGSGLDARGDGDFPGG